MHIIPIILIMNGREEDETKRMKINRNCIGIGAALILMGLICLAGKALSAEYIDAAGMLHENFFLIQTGFLFVFSGMTVVVVTFISYFVKKIRMH